MLINKNTNVNYTVRQLKLPLEIGKLIDISNPVYTFCEVMDHIDLSRYFVEKGCRTGRPRCDEQKLLKVILFSFMEHGISSLREIEKLCRNDIRYMYLLDGTKIEANANRYTWIWKKSCTKNRGKVFEKISALIDSMNHEVLGYMGTKLEKREEYAIDYVSGLLELYKQGTMLDESTFVSGCGHRKSIQQKQYQELQGYLGRLKTYAHHIEICGEERNSYSKTDHDATFMRIKRDYMRNDQLLPAYNLQTAICDEYIAVVSNV